MHLGAVNTCFFQKKNNETLNGWHSFGLSDFCYSDKGFDYEMAPEPFAEGGVAPQQPTFEAPHQDGRAQRGYIRKWTAGLPLRKPLNCAPYRIWRL